MDYHSSQHWDRVVTAGAGAGFAHNRALVRTLLDGIDTLPGATLLDIATGDGSVAIAAAARRARVVGIDISEAAIRRAATRAADLAAAPTFLSMDACRTTFPDDTFDVATCLRSFWVFPDPGRCLAELSRIIAPGGQLMIQLWGAPRTCRFISLGAAILGRRIPALRVPEGQTGPFDITPERLESELSAAGFGLETTAWHTMNVRASTPGDYWQKFSSVAGTAYAALVRQPHAVRAEIDQELLARSRKWQSPTGELVLPLTWAVCRARRLRPAPGDMN